MLLWPSPALTQIALDPLTGSNIGLFTATCVLHAGDPAMLRHWAHQARLTVLPPATAQSFLGRSPGRAWSASTETHKRVLASLDNGTCQLFLEEGDPLAAQEILMAALTRDGLSLEPHPTTTSADGLRTLRRLTARGHGRGWDLAIGSAIRLSATTRPPSIAMRATAIPP